MLRNWGASSKYLSWIFFAIMYTMKRVNMENTQGRKPILIPKLPIGMKLKSLPSSEKRGYPGGWAIPSMQEETTNPPASPVGKTGLREKI